MSADNPEPGDVFQYNRYSIALVTLSNVSDNLCYTTIWDDGSLHTDVLDFKLASEDYLGNITKGLADFAMHCLRSRNDT